MVTLVVAELRLPGGADHLLGRNAVGAFGIDAHEVSHIASSDNPKSHPPKSNRRPNPINAVVRPTADNPFMGKNQDPADALLQKIAQRTGLRLYLAGFSADLDPMKAKLLEAGFDAGDLKLEKFG